MRFTQAIKENQEQLLMTKVSWTKFWRCEKDFHFYIKYIETNKGKIYKDWKITIKKWELSDFGSIPRIFWLFLNPTKYIWYWCHDKIFNKDFKWITFNNYANIPERLNKWEWIFDWEKYIIKPTRLECDKILDEALKLEWASIYYRFTIRVWLFIWWWVVYYFWK